MPPPILQTCWDGRNDLGFLTSLFGLARGAPALTRLSAPGLPRVGYRVGARGVRQPGCADPQVPSRRRSDVTELSWERTASMRSQEYPYGMAPPPTLSLLDHSPDSVTRSARARKRWDMGIGSRCAFLAGCRTGRAQTKAISPAPGRLLRPRQPCGHRSPPTVSAGSSRG
jgi:hypothetical protein